MAPVQYLRTIFDMKFRLKKSPQEILKGLTLLSLVTGKESNSHFHVFLLRTIVYIRLEKYLIFRFSLDLLLHHLLDYFYDVETHINIYIF